MVGPVRIAVAVDVDVIVFWLLGVSGLISLVVYVKKTWRGLKILVIIGKSYWCVLLCLCCAGEYVRKKNEKT